MKLLYIITAILFLFAGNACQKEILAVNNQGVKFDHLLKTVTKISPTHEITTEYTYNSSNQVAEIKTTDITSASGTETFTETYFRNTTGRLDSVLFIGNQSGVLHYKSSTFFYYDVSGKLVLSKYDFSDVTNPTRKDSSLYTYSGNILQKRTDYRSFNAGINYGLLIEAAYEFDAAGNVSKAVFDWAISPFTTDTLIFQYDTKANPIPKANVFFYWAPIFYNDYKTQNNLLLVAGNNQDEHSSFDYQYAANNKPLYRKQTDPGNFIYETYYFYD